MTTDPPRTATAGAPAALDVDAVRAADDSDDTRLQLVTLAAIHDLGLGPVRPGTALQHLQYHPQIVAVQHRLEQRLLAAVDGDAERALGAAPTAGELADPDDAVGAIRALAADGLVPPVYDWVAEEASPAEVRAFVALEGGPDDSFDDLVAIAQVGLDGLPKLEAASNYWDELGEGDATGVHRSLHRDMAQALDLPELDRAELPEAALRRTLLCSTLATNRRLQPELLGLLGLIELQAGPRCRRVLTALRRIGAPAEAEPFYAVHAETDPRHGKAWLEHVVRPLAADPEWGAALVRGARWRWAANAAFFAEARRCTTHLATRSSTAASPNTED